MKNNQPLTIFETRVRPEWIDYNGHMNVAYYLTVFDLALDAFNDLVGLGKEYRDKTRNSLFALETRLTYQREVLVNDPLRVTLQLIDLDEKRIHFFERLYHADKDTLMATAEQLVTHVDLTRRHSSPFPPAIMHKLESLMAAHRKLPRPAEIDRAIGIRRNAKRGAA
jgi:acyl-CoA thioester hydrolase